LPALAAVIGLPGYPTALYSPQWQSLERPDFSVAGANSPPLGVTRFVGNALFQRLGDLSYSWYLWHWTVIIAAIGLWGGSHFAEAIGAAVSLGFAAGTHYLIERMIHYSNISGLVRWRH
jgi:peptidoglycan/LPS O-acetylase OafA/YrhL